MHDQKGFILTGKNFPSNLVKNFDHVKSIHDVIIKYFQHEKKIDKTKICVIGLGYVVPLAYEFSRKFRLLDMT